ncbi:hypothetical protein [Sphingomonas sp.]|uniref:hypothetical protein n=1 Tax=Sphingomonas sp. TaxID=28214 RepID=UPI0035C801FC
MRRAAAAIALATLVACRPNPRNEIAEIAGVAMEEVARTAQGRPLCVDRVIAPWQEASASRRVDPPAPPGYGDLYAAGTFRGGGGIKGDAIGGVRVGTSAACFDLRGPLVKDERAMIEVHHADIGFNVWQRRTDGVWRVAAVTTSVYAR